MDSSSNDDSIPLLDCSRLHVHLITYSWLMTFPACVVFLARAKKGRGGCWEESIPVGVVAPIMAVHFSYSATEQESNFF